MTLDAKLRWNEHVKIKIMELQVKWKNPNWLIGRKSKLSIENKLLIYNQILKPIWAYGAQFWGCTSLYTKFSEQNTQMHRKRTMVYTHKWFTSCLGVNTVGQEIENIGTKHNTRLRHHINTEASSLADLIGLERRLIRMKPTYLIRDIFCVRV